MLIEKKSFLIAAFLLICLLKPTTILIAQSATEASDGSATKVTPLLQAHAHNDYLHSRPLFDALDQGFCSVEADVFLVNGLLLVAHTQFELKPSATLESLYLKPLQQRIEQNQGSVYGDDRRFTLLVDFKTNGVEIYQALETLLERYPGLACRVVDGKFTPGPVQIIVSGDRPIDLITSDNDRQMGIDGRLSDLNSEAPTHLMPLISDQWSSHFAWKGRGEFPPDQAQKLLEIVEKVHTQGRRIRFWGIPDKANVWQVLKEAKVDLINTDRLSDLREFLLRSP